MAIIDCCSVVEHEMKKKFDSNFETILIIY